MKRLIRAGVSSFNVAGGKGTTELVTWIRASLAHENPNFPIIASGGRNEKNIQATIEAGANAITYSANGLTDSIFKEKMKKYRER